MAHQANEYHRNCDLVVGDCAWLSTEHLNLGFGLSRKLLVILLVHIRYSNTSTLLVLSKSFLFFGIYIYFATILS